MDLNIFETNESAIDGAWVDIEFRGQVGEFKIARAGNPKFTKIYTDLRNSRRFSNPESQEAKDFHDDCLNRALAEAILLDTGDEITINGEPVSYSPELGYSLLSNPAYAELKNQISVAAGDFEQYAIIKVEEAVKN